MAKIQHGAFAAQYEHFVPPAKIVPEWHKNFDFVLVESLEQLDSILVNPKYCAFDLETTGLDPEKDQIVGVAMCMDGHTGYYIPISHIEGTSLGKPALDKIYDFLRKSKLVFLYNVRFDFNMMEHKGYDMLGVPYYEVMLNVNYADSNKKLPSLKWSEKHFLGWEVQTFEEVLGTNLNLYYANPKDVVFYAATDAIGTFNLVRVTHKYREEGKLSAKIENEFLFWLMRCSNEQTIINVEKLDKIQEQTAERLRDLQSQIWTSASRVFDLSSPRQLADVLRGLGIDTGDYTDTGQMRTGHEVLEPLKDQHPAIPLIMEYQLLNKAYTAYQTTIAEQAKAKGGKLRFSYQTFNVPTGRVAAGSDSKNPYYAALNIQAVPKPHAADYFCMYTGEEDSENSILGWRFTLAPKGWEEDRRFFEKHPELRGAGILEGFQREGSIRDAFEPDHDSYWVSIDFKAQELRIPAILSGEPVWLKAFRHGEDLHTNMAILMWGKENYNKDKRKLAKICNFGILYGQNPWGFAKKQNISVSAAEEVFSSWWSAVSHLKVWKDRHLSKARKEGTVYTLFGRPRRVKWYLQHPESKMRAFGYRTAVNTVIQGTGADVLKLAFCRVCRGILYSEAYQRFVRFLSTIHDEINYSVKKSKIHEIAPKLVQAMVIRLPQWPIPMETSLSIGSTWGWMFEFRVTKEGKLEPAYKKIERS